MDEKSFISTLPAREREALALCGITQDRQLAAIHPQALLHDLQQAAELFPDTPPAIPALPQLASFCRSAAAAVEAQEVGVPQQTPPSPAPAAGPAPARSSQGTDNAPQAAPVPRKSQATGRALRGELNTARAQKLDEEHKQDDPRSFAHSIRCNRSFSIYLAAWVTWLLVIALIGSLACTAGMLCGQPWKLPLLACGAATAALACLYFLLLWRALCSTCRISIFSFRRYPRHRKAHHIPLLGYTLATALSVMFLLRFRCPSCSTPQKLYGARRRKH